MYVVWDMVIFEPWFLIEGILLAIAGWCFLKGARSRKVGLQCVCLARLLGWSQGCWVCDLPSIRVTASE